MLDFSRAPRPGVIVTRQVCYRKVANHGLTGQSHVPRVAGPCASGAVNS